MPDPADRPKFTSQKVVRLRPPDPATPDSISAWIDRYQQLAVAGVRSLAVAQKIELHLQRFQTHFLAAYGHERISTCLQRDVFAWQAHLKSSGLAPATINNHLASLSTFTTWVSVQAPQLFPLGDPAKGIRELALPPLEPRALSDEQVRSLKSVCDRLPRFHQLKGRSWQGNADTPPLHSTARPWRDRAIVYLLLPTGLRREELTRLDLVQLTPHSPDAIRAAHRLRINRVRGKGQSERSVFVSADARTAMADYLQRERHRDVVGNGGPLFLSATGIPQRSADGRISPRAINLILEQIGHWHDAEISDPTRHISPLHPHALRHTFAFQLARVTGSDAYELERRLGHRSQRYIARYTNPPEAIAAAYVEEF